METVTINRGHLPNRTSTQLKFLARCFAAAVAAHNFEEWLGLDRLPSIDTKSAGRFALNFARPPKGVFEVALIVATVVPVAILLACSRGKPTRLKTQTLAFVTGLFLTNVFVPHVAVSLGVGRYTPGLATALLINLPLAVLILRELVRSGALGRRILVLTVAASVPALPLAIAGAYVIAELFA